MKFVTVPNISTNCDFGSQMSQYASLFHIGKKTGLTPAFIKEHTTQGFGFPLDEPFNFNPQLIPLTTIQNNSQKLTIFSDSYNHIDNRVFQLSPDKNYVINGDLGLFKYFHSIKDEILKLYTFKEEIISFCVDYINSIKQNDELLISIHFRRGDYLQVSSLNLSLDYYYASVNYFKNVFPNAKLKFLIFSNGIEWVKENFKIENCVYVENFNRFQDMYLMSLCNHNIIANSSFSWWGAYLNQSPNNIVVCPHDYLNVPSVNYINGNYYPSEWIALNVK